MIHYLRACWRPGGWLPVVAALLMFGVFGVPTADAFEQYSIDGNSGNCADCHGDFRSSPYTSLADGQSWGDDLHDVHRSVMLNSDCNTCHLSGPRFPVLLGSSLGGALLDPISCSGCHGRAEDGMGTGSEGYGAGLRQHHWRAGETSCLDCHVDADPGGFTPVGEDILPPYYSNSDPIHPLIPSDPCNPEADGFPEDYAATTLGLDNDGDSLWDTDDPDCQQAVCGDGVVDPGEQCDDGNTLDGDCCSSTCTFDPDGSSCTDGQFCNGEETCDGAGSCQAGLPVDCSDGVGCTDDACDEDADACVNAPNDANCPDDGLFCDGLEFCDAMNDCQSTGDPCPLGTVCSEGSDTCDAVAACGNGILEPGEECDDGNTLDGDCCSSQCFFEPVGSSCSDGQFCNGEESCDGAGTCDAGLPVDCDDGVACTVDACDETADSCVSTANDSLCQDDGFFCSGVEVCDVFAGCVSTGDPCAAGTTCNEDTNTCDGGAGKVVICHIPRGNPDNAKTKRVDASSVPDHLAHGDFLGPCDDDDKDDEKDDDDEVGDDND
jgi:cysteine-rich repeat protein